MPDVGSLSATDETEMLERILAIDGADAFRAFVRDRLALDPDEAVLSVGCGPGFETTSLAADVDERGSVVGVDVNESSLAAARDRCADRPQVSVVRGDATALPFGDGRFDAAVAKQVLGFVPDVEAALAELYRVLAPGGRAAVVAGDADAMAIHATDRARMRRAMAVYREAGPHPNLGTRLRSLLPAAGFAVETVQPRPIVHTEINEQVERGIEVHRDALEADGSFDQSEIDAWERELRELDAVGEFLSSGTQFLYVARKPGGA